VLSKEVITVRQRHQLTEWDVAKIVLLLLGALAGLLAVVLQI